MGTIVVGLQLAWWLTHRLKKDQWIDYRGGNTREGSKNSSTSACSWIFDRL